MESASGSEYGEEEDNDFMRGGVRKRGPRGGKHMTVSTCITYTLTHHHLQ